MANPRISISTEIRQKLAALRAAGLSVEIISQSLLFLALSIALGMVFLLLEVLLELGSSARTVLVFLYITGLALFAAWFVARPLLQRFGILRPSSDFQLAGRVGEFFPSIRDRLLNLLQLHEEASHGSRYSPELIDASFQDLAPEVQSTDFLQAVDRSSVARSGKILFFSFLIVAVPALMTTSSVGNALYRLVHFSSEFVPESRVQFEVVPGNKELVKGESVSLQIRTHVSGRRPESTLSLRWRPEGQARFEEERLNADSTGVFITTLTALRLSTEYFAEYMGEESDRFLLTVVDRPVLRSLRVRLDYPSYTRLPSQIQDEFMGDVTALAGTRVTVGGTASKPLQSGQIVFKPDSSRAIEIRGQQFSVRFPLTAETPYTINVADMQGLSNADPVMYQLKVVPDEAPQILILSPAQVIDIAGLTSIPLLVQIKDDFGFSSLRLGYRLAQSRYEPISDQFRFLAVPLPEGTRASEDVSYLWDVDPLHLAPEDVVEYFLEVFDNDAVRGLKSARTPMHRLRLPSLQEVFADLDKTHEETLDDVAKTAEEARELKEKIESLNKDMKKNKEPDWQQQKNMEETAKRYQDLQEKMDEVQKKLESMVDQMSQQKVLSPETMEKYRELQEMLEQINSAELQDALKQLQQAMQAQNRERMQEALERVSFSEERFRESIERTMNLLKRIQIEQKLDELKRRAEELVTEQGELAEQTANEKANPEELAKKQENLKEKLGKMQEAAADVQNRMEEFFTEMPEQELQEANSTLGEKQVGQKMAQSSQMMRSRQMKQSQKLQEQIQNDLQSFSQDISQLQSEMLQQQQQYIINSLRHATNDMLELSKKQEDLKEKSKTAPANSQQLRQNAQEQLGALNDLGNVIDGLSQLAQRSFVTTPEMGKAIGEAAARMQAAMKFLDIRSGLAASQEQGKAMGALNQAAMEIQNALQSMMQQSGGQGGGLLSQLRSMAGQQMSINMRTMGAEDAARLAVEQEVLRKSLDQLNKEAKAGGEKERILGDLDRIASEMKEVVRKLEQNDVSPETVRRQEQILSRLLDAARSTRERDFENKRKAQTGTQVARRSPGELDPSTLEGRNRLRDDLLKAIEQGYSKDYQELIRKYFEQLQKVDN